VRTVKTVLMVVTVWTALSVLLALAWSALLGVTANRDAPASTGKASSARPVVTVNPVHPVRTVRPSWGHQAATGPWDRKAHRGRPEA
jgi:hypothetical protein